MRHGLDDYSVRGEVPPRPITFKKQTMNNSICNKCKNSVLSNSVNSTARFAVKISGTQSHFFPVNGNFCKIVMSAVVDIEECERFEKQIMRGKVK